MPFAYASGHSHYNDNGGHKDNVKDKLFGIMVARRFVGDAAKSIDYRRLLSDAMTDCRLVPGHDEVTIHQGGRVPCSGQSEVTSVMVVI